AVCSGKNRSRPASPWLGKPTAIIEPMDEGEHHNYEKHPSVEVFATTAAKKHELMQHGCRASQIVRTEQYPGNAHTIDSDGPAQPAHRPVHALETISQARPLAMHYECDSMERAPNDKGPCCAVP